MKKLAILTSLFFSSISFASLTPMNLTIHQEILDNARAVISGNFSPLSYPGLNTFPWSNVTSMCGNSNHCVSKIVVINSKTGATTEAGKIMFNPQTGVMTTLTNENGYQIIINGLAEATLEKIA